MKKTRLLWLIYKRLRTAFGVTLGFIIIYAAYTRNLVLALIPVALGFWFIHLFGDLYNDYQDFEQDLKNQRKDKWTTQKILNRNQIKNLSFLIGFLGIIFLSFTNVYVFTLGLIGLLTGILYSHPKIGLKRKELKGYFIIAIPVFFIPLALNTYFDRNLSTLDIIFGFYCFFHYLYLYCQKDSTDLKDDINIFLKRGWKSSSTICVIFSTLALLSFLFLSINSIILLATWTILVITKNTNLFYIYKRTINRKIRSRFILIEFIFPYLYALGTIV